MTATPRIAAKGQRLFAEGKVTPLWGHARAYRVEGDHGPYIVVVTDPETMEGFCPCKAHGPCSHLFSACLDWLADDWPY